jgi:hypothetical protein
MWAKNLDSTFNVSSMQGGAVKYKEKNLWNVLSRKWNAQL